MLEKLEHIKELPPRLLKKLKENYMDSVLLIALMTSGNLVLSSGVQLTRKMEKTIEVMPVFSNIKILKALKTFKCIFSATVKEIQACGWTTTLNMANGITTLADFISNLIYYGRIPPLTMTVKDFICAQIVNPTAGNGHWEARFPKTIWMKTRNLPVMSLPHHL